MEASCMSSDSVAVVLPSPICQSLPFWGKRGTDIDPASCTSYVLWSFFACCSGLYARPEVKKSPGVGTKPFQVSPAPDCLRPYLIPPSLPHGAAQALTAWGS